MHDLLVSLNTIAILLYVAFGVVMLPILIFTVGDLLTQWLTEPPSKPLPRGGYTKIVR